MQKERGSTIEIDTTNKKISITVEAGTNWLPYFLASSLTHTHIISTLVGLERFKERYSMVQEARLRGTATRSVDYYHSYDR